MLKFFFDLNFLTLNFLNHKKSANFEKASDKNRSYLIYILMSNMDLQYCFLLSELISSSGHSEIV